MARGTNQKFKLWILIKIMQDKTDDEHSLTMPQIIQELEKYDITAERKSIYADFQDMSDKLGIEIIKEQIGRETYYRIGARQFELPEVKILVDAIQSSKFITQEKSRELISKVKTLVSEHQAKQLQRQVYITNRVKTMNSSVYYNIDYVHSAINENKKISFKYYKWDINKELVARHDGLLSIVSPWALIWDDENYYMVAYDELDHKIKHYRVDKMKHISICDEVREGEDSFRKLDFGTYSQSTFGMFGGELTKVTIQFRNQMCGVLIDRFGTDITIIKVDDESSQVTVNIAVSQQFFGWLFGLGNGVKVTAPDAVVKQIADAAKAFASNY